MKYGFIKPVIKSDHYVFGGGNVPFVEHRPDGNWFNSRPGKELQSTNFESYNCTGFNTAAQIECYMKEVFGIDANYSDRWIGIVAGTKEPGNDPQIVYEAIRKNGLIPDSMLPWSSDIQNVDEYYSFKGGNEALCRELGKKWLEKYEFFHEWVNTDSNTPEEKLHNIKVALKSSPLSRAVYAWYQDERGVYTALDEENHWSFQYFEDMYSKFEDSYEPTLKDVDQNINFCKRIYIKEKATPVTAPVTVPVIPAGVSPSVSVEKTFWQKILDWILSFISGHQSQ